MDFGCSQARLLECSLSAASAYRERASGSTHLQLLAGTPSWLYWACNLGWDLLQCSISAISILMLLHWYALPHFSGARCDPCAHDIHTLGLGTSVQYRVLRHSTLATRYHLPFACTMHCLSVALTDDAWHACINAHAHVRAPFQPPPQQPLKHTGCFPLPHF